MAALGSGVFAILVGFFLSRYLVSPMQKLIEATEKIAQGKYDAAKSVYQESLMLWQTLERKRPSVKPKAGLALLALDAGDQVSALQLTEEILLYLENNNIDGTDEPFRIYWACYRVLMSTGDARADDFLAATYQRLQRRANAIDNPSHRRAFLEDVPFHKQIVEAFANAR